MRVGILLKNKHFRYGFLVLDGVFSSIRTKKKQKSQKENCFAVKETKRTMLVKVYARINRQTQWMPLAKSEEELQSFAVKKDAYIIENEDIENVFGPLHFVPLLYLDLNRKWLSLLQSLRGG